MANISKSEQLKNISELGFACVDLNLYLDNHPEDKNAVCLYNSLSQQYKEAIRSYEKKFGPLLNFGHSNFSCPSDWIDEPWPWQKEFYC